MDSALKLFVTVTVVATSVVFGARALLYVLSYSAVGDLRNGDLAALDKLHTYRTWTTADFWATIVSAVVLSRLQRRWIDAGNANALTRPGIGLSWLRTMPSSNAFQRWQLAQTASYLLIVFLNIAFRNATSDDRLRAWAVLEVLLCSAVIAASTCAMIKARRVTAELLERLDMSEQAAQAARVAEPDPVLGSVG